MLVGLSVETVAQAEQAAALDVAYLGVGPIFPTGTKVDAGPALGIEGLALLRAASRHTLVGIGGIHAANAGDVIRAGADGIAVVSAICCAPDPQQAAAEIRNRIFTTKAQRHKEESY
jgi:thiamine-phosphate pyrophosphorylase